MEALAKDLEAWLRAFARSVRRRDVGSARKLFARGVIAFGTVCSRADGLRELSARQWSVVWPHTRGFEFVYPSARAVRSADQAAIVAGWSSSGINGFGGALKRRGRATIILRRRPSGWKAVHTHFSLNPAVKA